jgi:hypothetical protein
MKITKILLVMAGLFYSTKSEPACVEGDSGIDFYCGNIPKSPCDEFELTHGRVTPGTNIYVLGEEHNTPKTIDCINKLTAKTKKHVIYQEGTNAKKEVGCHFPITKKPGRICKGWDDREAAERTLALMKDFDKEKVSGRRNFWELLMSIKEEREALGRNDEALDHKLKQKKQQLQNPNIKLVSRNAPNNKVSPKEIKKILEAVNYVLNRREKGMSYEEIFESYHVNDKEYKMKLSDLPEFQGLEKKREKSLKETVAKHPIGQVGIFVVGRVHLAEESGVIASLKEHGEPFAVLQSTRVG